MTEMMHGTRFLVNMKLSKEDLIVTNNFRILKEYTARKLSGSKSG